MTPDVEEFDPRVAIQIRGSSVGSFDNALEYLRFRGLGLFLLYLLAMLPMSLVAYLLIDALGLGDWAAVQMLTWWMVPATLWRWVGLSWLQSRVQSDLQGRAGLPLRRRLLAILVLRLYGHLLVTWGSVLILPAFYGIFLGSFAAPMLLERPGAAYPETRTLLSWIAHTAAPLRKALLFMTILSLMAMLTLWMLQQILLELVLPSLLGIETPALNLATAGWVWHLGLAYLLFLAVDFFWTLASVFLYYDCQSRRTGSDLRARFQHLAGSLS